MRNMFLALATGAALCVSAIAADAAPVAVNLDSAQAPQIIRVAEGCGPGFHRGPMGRCRPNGRIIAPVCPLRRTPMGWRRRCL